MHVNPWTGLEAIVQLTETNSQVLFGLFMIGMSPDLGTAGNVLVFLVCSVNWFNGIIVPYEQIQVLWRYWVRDLLRFLKHPNISTSASYGRRSNFIMTVVLD
jgi:hypothetical protein